MAKIMFYLENGDVYMGANRTISEALRIMKEKGYKKYYRGKHYQDNQTCIVAIDTNNKVDLIQRTKNGLWDATEHKIR